MYANEEAAITAFHCLIVFGLFGLSFFTWFIIRTQAYYRRSNRLTLKQELKIMEGDRLRLSFNLHDDVKPWLSMSHKKLDKYARTGEGTPEQLREVVDWLGQAMTALGHTADNLRAHEVVSKGLEASVYNLMEDLDSRWEMDVSFLWELKKEVHPEAALHLYRIVQELTLNTIRHARATRVSFALVQRGNSINMDYFDNGIGFERSECTRGIGMRSLDQRVELLGGRMAHRRPQGGGSLFLFSIPKRSIYGRH